MTGLCQYNFELDRWEMSPLGDQYDHAAAANFERIDPHSGTVCGCIKRCVYDGGAGYRHHEMWRAGEEPKYPALSWD